MPRTENGGGNSWKRLGCSSGHVRDDDEQQSKYARNYKKKQIKYTDHNRSVDDGLRSIQGDDVISDRRMNFTASHDNVAEVAHMSEPDTSWHNAVTTLQKY